LLGDPRKAKKILNWEPKIKVQEMVSEMVKEDINTIKNET